MTNKSLLIIKIIIICGLLCKSDLYNQPTGLQWRPIYQQGIDTGNATMETRGPLPEAMANAYMPSPQLVAVEDDTVIGYALLTAVSGRCVFSGVAEVSLICRCSSSGQRRWTKTA